MNVCRLVVNLADDFQPQGWDKDVQIRVSKNPLDKAPDVLVIRPLISQVFANVIENAVKYAQRSSVIVIDGMHDPGRDMVIANVRNHGIPLRTEDARRVFDRGYRTQEARNLYPAGTGFGLYIARRIVELHEGLVSASTDGQGRVVFTVALSVRGLEGKAREREPKDHSSR